MQTKSVHNSVFSIDKLFNAYYNSIRRKTNKKDVLNFSKNPESSLFALL